MHTSTIIKAIILFIVASDVVYNIPYWDIFIIPNWYNKVKSNYEKGIVMTFRLKEIRKKKKISQQRLAIDLNMNQNTISRYENMERQADYETLVRFADYFDVSLDYLLGRCDTEK
jgi:DNA-binding XRE family transcriptional regulator